MTTLHYYMIDPTKNITALAETPVPPASRPFAAARIMAEEPDCEQVGFVYRNAAGEPCLDMAGGEFCGNASMSAAALLCAKAGMAAGERRQVTLHVSGAPERVCVAVTVQEEGVFACTVKLPPPEAVTEVSLPVCGKTVRLPVVYLPGIAHIMVTKDELDAAAAQRSVRGWCKTLGTAGLGVMLFDPAFRTLRPLVYVPGSDTLFWESSCASGTGALGAYLAKTGGKPADLTVNEPGGTLRVQASPEGEILLSGLVRLRYDREIIIDC